MCSIFGKMEKVYCERIHHANVKWLSHGYVLQLFFLFIKDQIINQKE
jgi:hypothetical protein